MLQQNYLELMDLAPAFRERVRQSGYLDVTAIHPDDVLYEPEHVDVVAQWPCVLTLINVTDVNCQFRTIVMTTDHRILKLRQTINKLMSDLQRAFPIDFKYTIKRLFAPKVKITRHIPYVCSDFWLMPVGLKQGNNYSWFRWMVDTARWDYRQTETVVSYPDYLPLRLPHGKTPLEARQEKCWLIAEFIKALYEACISVWCRGTRQVLSVESIKAREAVDMMIAETIMIKLLGDNYDDALTSQLIKEIKRGDFSQLVEMVVPDGF